MTVSWLCTPVSITARKLSLSLVTCSIFPTQPSMALPSFHANSTGQAASVRRTQAPSMTAHMRTCEAHLMPDMGGTTGSVTLFETRLSISHGDFGSSVRWYLLSGRCLWSRLPGTDSAGIL